MLHKSLNGLQSTKKLTTDNVYLYLDKLEQPLMEDVVRPELNLEKWPGIWQPSRSNSKLTKIILERGKADNSISRIEITSNSEYGVLTTETQKVIYALYKISEEKGHPKRIPFSRRKIAKILKKPWGKKVAEVIEKSLYQLRFTAFVLKDAFYDASSKKKVNFIKTFTILSNLEMSDEEIDGHVTKEACYCEFNEYIYNNLVNNYVKPLYLDTFLMFGDDGIAQLLYSHFDLMLSKSNEYRRLIKDVFRDINLVGKEYQKASVRKRTLERIKAKLDGKKLSSGGVLRLRVEKLAKDEDYELVAIKELKPTGVSEETNTEDKKQPSEADKRRIEKLAKAIFTDKRVSKENNEGLANETARELVELFHKRFFNLENVKVSSKELTQAKELIKEYGLIISKYIISYAYSQAIETNYRIGQFGAVLEYAGRGAAQYEKDTKKENYLKKLEVCELCSSLIYVDIITIENGKECYRKFKCPHDLEKLETTAKEKQIKFRLVNGIIIDFQN